MPSPEFNSITIIGIGLIGGSIGLACKRLEGTRVIGHDADPSSMEKALELGAIDEAAGHLPDAVKRADLVVIATSVGQVSRIFEQIADHLRPGTVVTDVGSTKQKIIEDIHPLMPETVTFIGGHPIAGSEKKGVTAATADMFVSAPWVLTPVAADPDETERLSGFLTRLGARVVLMDPSVHDRALALSSHLPQMISSVLMSVAARSSHEGVPLIPGRGFMDLTRLAGSDPGLWVEIAEHNRDAIVGSISLFLDRLSELQQEIAAGKWDEVRNLLTDARDSRQQQVASAASSSEYGR